MRETLRLAPPAPLRAATSLEDTTLKGKYPVQSDTTKIWCNVYEVHRDAKVWGPDVSDNVARFSFALCYPFIGTTIPPRAHVGWQVRGNACMFVHFFPPPQL